MSNPIKNIVRNYPLIAAHRGSCGGNIPCNTMEAFETALIQGADIIELDVSHSSDGKLFVFHPGMEKAMLKSDKLLSELTAKEIEKLRYINGDDTPTQFGISYLEDVFKQLRGRCVINIDKFWDNIVPVTALVRELGMQDQVIVKTGPVKEQIDLIEKEAPDLPYMLILWERDDYSDIMLKRDLRYIGTEVLFHNESDPIADRTYVERMHEKDLIVWVNAIVYDYKEVLSAGHNDDISVPGNPDAGWGWLLDKGYDIIQTDWTLMLKNYMHERTAKK